MAGGVFRRLLEVVRPQGGLVMMLEGYYDESGDLEVAPGVFCVSGYLIESEAAKEMDRLWRGVLAEHNIPYFHMVDCAHEPPGGPFVGMEKAERSLIVRKLIELIKAHTLEGISVVARASTYKGPRMDEPDAYSQFASSCAQGVQLYKAMHGVAGGVAYFFEKGHRSKGNAYNYIADNITRPEDSLTFAGKTEVPLLQAADILAWQTAKYAKDYFHPWRLDGKPPKRQPRKDFQSLMEHTHMFMHLDTGKDNNVAGIEIWPMHRRSLADININIVDPSEETSS